MHCNAEDKRIAKNEAKFHLRLVLLDIPITKSKQRVTKAQLILIHRVNIVVCFFYFVFHPLNTFC